MILECRLQQILLGALRVKYTCGKELRYFDIYSKYSTVSIINS